MLQRGNKINGINPWVRRIVAFLSSGHQGVVMRAGQKVRLKSASPLKQRLNLPPGAQGAVLCAYRLLRSADLEPHRVDVRFGPELVVWGAPDDQFEAIEEDFVA
jgi:hypothetical protein